MTQKIYDPAPNAMEQKPKGGVDAKCRYCENMAKNFLYLESLIRNNGAKGDKKCALCTSSLKYLEYVNRNIRQVFSNFDAITQADRALAAKPAVLPKYSVAAQSEKADSRAKGGAIVSAQKSVKSLKSKAATLKVKGFKGQKSLKSIRSLKALRSSRSTKSTKSAKSTKSTKPSKFTKSLKAQKSPMKLARSGSKGAHKGLAKSKSVGHKSHISHGKMILKRKFRTKAASKAGANKMVRSVSQYRGVAASRSKLSKGRSLNKLAKQRSAVPSASINWRLLKQNMPRRKPTLDK